MSIVGYIPLLMLGALMTLAAWIVACSLSLLIGTALGVFSSNQIGSGRWAWLIKIYTFIAKGIPAYVQILIAYFVIPALLGINVSGFVAATGALAFCSSGYVAEIVRSGINAIERGQWDACFVLGYPLRNTLSRVILPQALANIGPALVGECEQLLKSTSLLATIGVTELTRAGMNIISRELDPLPVYLAVAVFYLAFSAVLQGIMVYVERRGRYGYR